MSDRERQLKEKIREEFKLCAQSPVYFIKKYVKIEHPGEGIIPFSLFEFQEGVLDCFQKNNKNIVLKARQMGISTVTAAYCLWLMVFHNNKKIICLATKQDTAKEIVTRCKFAYENLPSWLKPEAIENNKLSLELKTGGRISAETAAPDSARGKALSLLVIDEVAAMKDAEDIWLASQSAIMHGGGNCIMISTPKGVGGFYHKMWVGAENGENGFNAIRLHWQLHPDYTPEWRDEQTKLLGDRGAKQECDGSFLGTGDTVISEETLKYYRECGMIKPPIQKSYLGDTLWTWAYPDYNRRYLVCADVARGDAEDFSGAHVIDIDAVEQVAEFKGKISPKDYGAFLIGLASQYNNALLVIENNSFGHTTIQECIDRQYPNLFYCSNDMQFVDVEKNISNKLNSEAKKMVPGHTTSSKNRVPMISKTDGFMRETKDGKGSLTIHSSRTIDEFDTFVWNGVKPEAMRGYNDDLIMSLCIGLWVRDTSMRFRDQRLDIQKTLLGKIGKTVIQQTRPIKTEYSSANKEQQSGPTPIFSNTIYDKKDNPFIYKMGGGHVEDFSWLLK